MPSQNIDERVVLKFGDQWSRFDQQALDDRDLLPMFERYFAIFPWQMITPDCCGFDMGCGSGRWARFVAPRVRMLHCFDASGAAVAVARCTLSAHSNAIVEQCSVDAIPSLDKCFDFGYSLGVLHHVPDTAAALRSCASKLKPGAPFLLYLYYAFDDRPWWFRALWRLSDFMRRVISRLPRSLRNLVCELIAGSIYFPLARAARLLERAGVNVRNLPLSTYRNFSFYVMRTDALDRFGTTLEQRFTRQQIAALMESAGFSDLRFSENEPFWCVVGYRQVAVREEK
jgi:SAM-dependent methyltransferase